MTHYADEDEWDFSETAPGPRWNERRPVDPRGTYRRGDDGPPDDPRDDYEPRNER